MVVIKNKTGRYAYAVRNGNSNSIPQAISNVLSYIEDDEIFGNVAGVGTEGLFEGSATDPILTGTVKRWITDKLAKIKDDIQTKKLDPSDIESYWVDTVPANKFKTRYK